MVRGILEHGSDCVKKTSKHVESKVADMNPNARLSVASLKRLVAVR